MGVVKVYVLKYWQKRVLRHGPRQCLRRQTKRLTVILTVGVIVTVGWMVMVTVIVSYHPASFQLGLWLIVEVVLRMCGRR